MTKKIPICFYPTRKIILDDDNIFSESILLKMDNKVFSSYASPDSLLNYLFKEYHPIFNQSDLFETKEKNSELAMYHNFQIPIKKLRSIIANSFAHDISVILVDYHMPNMTGIDFLNQTINYPFKKILITGEQDYAIGIDALNSGLIDAYIRKDDPDLLNKLTTLINTLEWKYFTDLSASAYHFSEFDYLANSGLLEKFQQYILENKITAFFLENKDGNFSGFNSNGEKNFVVRSKKQLQELAILAEEDGASKEIIRHLMCAEVTPYFGNKQYWEIPAAKWGDFLYPANLIANDSNFVWSVIPTYTNK